MLATHWVGLGFGAKASAFVLLQGDAIDSGNAKTLEAFVIVAAVSLLIVACVMVGLAVVALKAKNEIMGHVNEIKGKLIPLIDKSHGLVTDLTPEIKKITTQVHEISVKANDITGKVNDITAVVKEKVVEISPTVSQANVTVQEALSKAKVTFADANQTVGDVNQKTRQQIERMNGMVSDALDATTRLGRAIENGIHAPGRELAGLLAGAKATADSLLKSTTGTLDSLKKSSSGVGVQLAGKFASLFAKKPAAKSSGATRPASAPARPAAPAEHGGRFAGLASAGGSGTAGTMEPGVSSGSSTNGDPILS